MRAIDFTTYYISQVSPADLKTIRSEGYSHAIIGMDSAPASVQVVLACLEAGFTWDAYRVVYSDRDPVHDVDDCVQGILAVYLDKQANWALPGVVWLDIEERPAIPSQAQVIAAADRLTFHEIGPQWQVQAGCYSGKWVWDNAGWGDWSYLADHGFLLWANAKQALWGGWQDHQLAGYQTAYDVPMAIGNCDQSTMRDRSILLLNQPAL